MTQVEGDPDKKPVGEMYSGWELREAAKDEGRSNVERAAARERLRTLQEGFLDVMANNALDSFPEGDGSETPEQG